MDQHTAQHPSTHRNWYDRSYKWMLLLPAIFFVFSIVYLTHFSSQNGDIIFKDVSLTGGTTITVFATADLNDVKNALGVQFPDIEVRGISDIRTGQLQAFFVETSAPADQVKTALEGYLGYALTKDNSSIEFTGSTLSSSFYQQLRIAIIISFILMAIVVFILFKTPIRSLSVIIACFFDIMFTIVVLDLFGVRLSTGGIIALLMLIGYAVDTDILVTTRVVRDKEGTVNQRIYGAFKTGITMTLTAIAAAAVALIFTHSFSHTLAQIFSILLIGLGFDIFNTWITNASILKWYTEVKKIS